MSSLVEHDYESRVQYRGIDYHGQDKSGMPSKEKPLFKNHYSANRGYRAVCLLPVCLDDREEQPIWQIQVDSHVIPPFLEWPLNVLVLQQDHGLGVDLHREAFCPSLRLDGEIQPGAGDRVGRGDYLEDA